MVLVNDLLETKIWELLDLRMVNLLVRALAKTITPAMVMVVEEVKIVASLLGSTSSNPKQ